MAKVKFVSESSLFKRRDVIRKLAPESLILESERYKYSIKDLKSGGFVKLDGCVCFVTRVGRYDEYDDAYAEKKDYSAQEFRLLNLNTGEIVNVEWSEDDELEVFVSIKKLSFLDLSDDIGDRVDDEDLEEIVDEKDSVFFDSLEFEYSDDWAAMYIPEGKRKGERAYIYEFKSGNLDITIEEWNNGEKEGDYEIWLSKQIDPDSIEIISVGG